MHYALRAQGAWGCKQRLQPRAVHMAERRLARARGDAGAALWRLDVDVLRKALSSLLCHDREHEVIIYQLVVEGVEPSVVAAERGVTRLMLTEQLRAAIDQLATEYEDVAYASVRERRQERAQSAPAKSSLPPAAAVGPVEPRP